MQYRTNCSIYPGRSRLASGVITLLLACALPATLPYRAAYDYGNGSVWSADVTLPGYVVVNLGGSVTPIAVNDRGTVLFRNNSGQLIRWQWGEETVLMNQFPPDAIAHLNEVGTVVVKDFYADDQAEIQIWEEGSQVSSILPYGNSHITAPHYAETYALNDMDELALTTSAEELLYFPPPQPLHIETNIVSLTGNTWTELSQYEYMNSMDFILRQGGRIHDIHDLNNYRETVGYVYEDSATSSAWDPEIDYAFQNEFYALDGDTALSFEPLRINDRSTIIGRTDEDYPSLVILDQFGQRVLEHNVPALRSLGEGGPALSNPDEGPEEIVFKNHYWRRMVERRPSGDTSDSPSPDFHKCDLDELVNPESGWRSLEGKCISANGRIVGTGVWQDPSTASASVCGFLMIPNPLLPDWNRDGAIDEQDRELSGQDKPFYLWINDDNDENEVADSWRDDAPGRHNPDWDNNRVDGLRDVVDFFPIQLDLKKILESINDLGGVEITLSHANGALNLVYTSLHPRQLDQLFAPPQASGYGSSLHQALPEAETLRITPEGIQVPNMFLQQLKAEDRGVLLLEGRAETSAPLILRLKRDGNHLLQAELSLSVAPVSDMFRIINLRNCDSKFASVDPGPWPTSTGDPPNLPDRWLERLSTPLRTLVHVHGYNWTGEEATAAHAELFKRFYQTGSNARFVGVTWRGDEGTSRITGSSIEYNENVINSFITAFHMSDALIPFSGPLTAVFAHSLGNMVTSSAINDFGLNVGAYFMVNAAVPREAYMGETLSRSQMTHPDWKDLNDNPDMYDERLMATNWYRLFQDNDNRSLLKWKDRFSNLSNLVRYTNYHSTGEEVLRISNGELPSLLLDVLDTEQVWVYNEMVKGVDYIPSMLISEVHGGWGFNGHYKHWEFIVEGDPTTIEWFNMPTSEAAQLTDSELIANPFFTAFSDGDNEFPAWGDGQWLYGDTNIANNHLPAYPLISAPLDLFKNHAKILAEAIPAHSAPAGSMPVSTLSLLQNIDMSTVLRMPSFWPDREDAEKNHRWLHNDYMKLALSHVIGLYRHCVESITQLQ
ncbi:MAG: hypothetical protein AB3N63_13365 [Puniceicoccaceae bacterium]